MNLNKSLLKLTGCCSLISLLTGCASFVCGPKQTVAIDTKPHGATVQVYDGHCEVIMEKTTPCSVKLSRRTEDYDGANYVVLIKKEGFAPVQVPLTAQVNRAYFANVLTAGIGFAIDPITGGMWTLTPDSITSPTFVENDVTETPGFVVTLKSDETVVPDVAQQEQAAPPVQLSAVQQALEAQQAQAQQAPAAQPAQAAEQGQQTPPAPQAETQQTTQPAQPAQADQQAQQDQSAQQAQSTQPAQANQPKQPDQQDQQTTQPGQAPQQAQQDQAPQ